MHDATMRVTKPGRSAATALDTREVTSTVQSCTGSTVFRLWYKPRKPVSENIRDSPRYIKTTKVPP